MEKLGPDDWNNIQTRLNEIDEEDLKEDIKGLFNYFITGVSNCGEMIFTAEYEDMNEEFQDITLIDQKQKFMDLFYDLHIVEKAEEWC